MRNNWVGLIQGRLLGFPVLMTSACYSTSAPFFAPNVRDPGRTTASIAPVSRPDTSTRPLEIYNYSESELGAIRAVLRTRAEFDRIWETLRRDKSEPPPQIDFSKDMVIVAGMGWQAEGGYRIRVSNVTDTAHVLDVRVELGISTAKCTIGYPAEEHPAVLVRVPQSISTPVFQDRVFRTC